MKLLTRSKLLPRLALVLGLLALPPLGATPKRLTLREGTIFDELLRPIILRGANVNANDESVAPATAADEMKNTYKMNCVRLPVEFKYFPEGHPSYDDRTIDEDGDLIDLYTYSLDTDGTVMRVATPNSEADIVELTRLWVEALTAQGLWVFLEARSNDCDTNAILSNFYDISSARHASYQAFWLAIANEFKNTDYIAGYGLLAEPSASRVVVSAPGSFPEEPVTTLTDFQLSLMGHITTNAGDTWTPFFAGADFNYDTLQFRYQNYDVLTVAYPNRVVYEVNVLMPKPWIQHGGSATNPGVPVDPVPEWDPCYGAHTSEGTAAGTFYTYPQTAASDYGVLLQRNSSEIAADNPKVWEEEKIFNKRRVETANFPTLLNKNFFEWYLEHYAIPFMAEAKVPMIMDQFGASTSAGGQLTYERDLLEVAEKFGLHWTRWGYNAGSSTRKIRGNAAVEAYYDTIGDKIAAGEVIAHGTASFGGATVTRVRAENYSRQIPATPDSFRWQLLDDANALDAFSLRAKAVGSGATLPADATSPRMDFRVKFPTSLSYPTTFYLWVRLKEGSSTYGVWYGLDGTPDSGQLASAAPSSWSWVKRLSNSSSPALISVGSSGFHTLNIWMNKSTVCVDEIILTTSATFDPNVDTLPSYSLRRVELPNP